MKNLGIEYINSITISISSFQELDISVYGKSWNDVQVTGKTMGKPTGQVSLCNYYVCSYY